MKTTLHDLACKVANRGLMRYPDTLYHGGNCLDFAVGFALGLQERGYKAGIALIYRDADLEEDPQTTAVAVPEIILSHAATYVDTGIKKDPRWYFDSDGYDAYRRWVTQFNHTQWCNGDPQAEFWEDIYPDDLMGRYRQIHNDYNMNARNEALLEYIRTTIKV